MDNTDISEYEKGAVNNMKLMEKVLEEMDSDTEDEIKEMRDSTQRKQEEQRKILTAKRSNTSSLSKGRNKRPATPNSHKLRWSSLIPEEDRRRSFRLQNKPATYFGEDLPVEEETRSVKRARLNSNPPVHRLSLTDPIPVENITKEYIDNFADSSMLKTHSANGTTCHQCRQKTLDSKTICRSGKCHGLYGQFCAPCLKNRYGEVAQEVILDPNWSCPYCKGRCNCSICRTRQGKRPTGILAPVAFQEGFNGVSEYLDSLDGYGDYSEHTNDDESESLASEETENVDSV